MIALFVRGIACKKMMKFLNLLVWNDCKHKLFNRDHLDNVREVVSETGEVKQVNAYYPFGTPIHALGTNESQQRYKYNGKEFDELHGLNTYDYGARQYAPLLPMWDRVDPLAEKYYGVFA